MDDWEYSGRLGLRRQPPPQTARPATPQARRAAMGPLVRSVAHGYADRDTPTATRSTAMELQLPDHDVTTGSYCYDRYAHGHGRLRRQRRYAHAHAHRVSRRPSATHLSWLRPDGSYGSGRDCVGKNPRNFEVTQTAGGACQGFASRTHSSWTIGQHQPIRAAPPTPSNDTHSPGLPTSTAAPRRPTAGSPTAHRGYTHGRARPRFDAGVRAGRLGESPTDDVRTACRRASAGYQVGPGSGPTITGTGSAARWLEVFSSASGAGSGVADPGRSPDCS